MRCGFPEQLSGMRLTFCILPGIMYTLGFIPSLQEKMQYFFVPFMQFMAFMFAITWVLDIHVTNVGMQLCEADFKGTGNPLENIGNSYDVTCQVYNCTMMIMVEMGLAFLLLFNCTCRQYADGLGEKLDDSGAANTA